MSQSNPNKDFTVLKRDLCKKLMFSKNTCSSIKLQLKGTKTNVKEPVFKKINWQLLMYFCCLKLKSDVIYLQDKALK